MRKRIITNLMIIITWIKNKSRRLIRMSLKVRKLSQTILENGWKITMKNLQKI